MGRARVQFRWRHAAGGRRIEQAIVRLANTRRRRAATTAGRQAQASELLPSWACASFLSARVRVLSDVGQRPFGRRGLSGGGFRQRGRAVMMIARDDSWVSRIASLQDKSSYKELHWEGTFEEYLRIVRENPRVTRTAFQRIYDMILSHGKTEYIDNKKKLIRYHFFHDEQFGGRDAVFGLDVPLMKLVNVFKSAAQGYGTEKRVILLHGPVGSSKSTIVRLLKKGLEEYSRTPDGALYTFQSVLDRTSTE